MSRWLAKRPGRPVAVPLTASRAEALQQLKQSDAGTTTPAAAPATVSRAARTPSPQAENNAHAGAPKHDAMPRRLRTKSQAARDPTVDAPAESRDTSAAPDPRGRGRGPSTGALEDAATPRRRPSLTVLDTTRALPLAEPHK